MADSRIYFKTIAETASLIKKKKISPVEVVRQYIERVKKVDGKTNSYITILEEEALKDAARAEKEIADGKYKGPLHGVPIALKDLYYTKGIRTTGGSKVKDWAEFVPNEDATVVKKLKKAGAIIIGKLNMHEFASGATNENPNYGSSKNPWDLERITGGSSGGSGAAVAADLCAGALGSDTGGSIRIPAALCGIVGLKPTFGRVSCYGVLPLAWSMDHPGPMTKSVEDAALVMNVISGYDEDDPSTVNVPVPDFTELINKGVEGTKIGICREYFFETVDSEVKDAVAAAIDTLTKEGAIVEDVSIPSMDYSGHLRNIISMVESAAYHESLTRKHAAEVTPNVRDRLELGLMIPASYYIKAQRARTVIEKDFRKALGQVDVIITPATAIAAPKIGQKTMNINDKEEEVLSLLGKYTRPANQTGFPACSIPCGFTSQGLPIGLQLIGRPFDEAEVLRVASAYESVTEWHKRRPEL